MTLRQCVRLSTRSIYRLLPSLLSNPVGSNGRSIGLELGLGIVPALSQLSSIPFANEALPSALDLGFAQGINVDFFLQVQIEAEHGFEDGQVIFGQFSGAERKRFWRSLLWFGTGRMFV